MSIASEITRINGNIAAAYTAASGKGATLPATQNSANLANCIATISGGGASLYGRYYVSGGTAIRQSGAIPANAFSGITAVDDDAWYEEFKGLNIDRKSVV